MWKNMELWAKEQQNTERNVDNGVTGLNISQRKNGANWTTDH